MQCITEALVLLPTLLQGLCLHVSSIIWLSARSPDPRRMHTVRVSACNQMRAA